MTPWGSASTTSLRSASRCGQSGSPATDRERLVAFCGIATLRLCAADPAMSNRLILDGESRLEVKRKSRTERGIAPLSECMKSSIQIISESPFT